MSTASRGRSYEHRVRDLLTGAGYYVIRAAGSKGVVDLVALRGEHTLLVQVKGGTPRLDPVPWNALYDLAWRTGGVPLLAQVEPRKPISLWILTGRKDGGGRSPYEPYVLSNSGVGHDEN